MQMSLWLDKLDTEAGVKLRRIDIPKEVKQEKENMKRKKSRDLWFRIKSTAINIYYGMTVKNIAGKLS